MSEQLARRFHETYERLAPQFGYKTRKETREFDPRSPNGKLMIAVCAEIEAAKDAEIGRLREALLGVRAYFLETGNIRAVAKVDEVLFSHEQQGKGNE